MDSQDTTMVHIRSQSGEEGPSTIRVFDLPPRSPSGTTTDRRDESTPLPAGSEGRLDRGEGMSVKLPRANRAGRAAFTYSDAPSVRDHDSARFSEHHRSCQLCVLRDCPTHTRGSNRSSASSYDRHRDERNARPNGYSPIRRAESNREDIDRQPRRGGKIHTYGREDATASEPRHGGYSQSNREENTAIFLSETDRLMMDLDSEYLKKKEKLKKRIANNLASLKNENLIISDTQSIERVQSWANESLRHEDNKPKPRARGNDNVRERERVQRYENAASPPRRSRRKSPEHGVIEKLAEAIARVSTKKTPKIELPDFSGNPLEWTQFKSAFVETSNTYHLTNSEKLTKFRNCLKGEAKEIAMPLLNASKNPDAVLKLLERCFGRPEDLVFQSVEELRKLPRIGKTARELNRFAIKVETTVAVLSSVRREYLYNPSLVGDVINKLDSHQKARWYDYAEEQLRYRREPEIVLLSEYLQREADRALRFEHGNATSNIIKKEERPAINRSGPKRAVFNINYEADADKELRRQCAACRQDHELPQCKTFVKMTTKERFATVKRAQLCFRCLISTHRSDKCRKPICGVTGCRHSHHKLLHYSAPPRRNPEDGNHGAEPSGAAANEQQSVAAAMGGNQNVLLKMCEVTLRGPKGEARIYALFDEGSTVTLLDDRIAEKIGARGRQRSLTMKGINTTWQEVGSRAVNMKIRGTDGTAHSIVARTVRGLDLKTQSIPEEVKCLDHLKNLNQKVWLSNVKPLLLIGSDNWQLIVTRSLRLGKRDQPAASQTQLGWVIHGAMPRRIITREQDILHVAVIHERDDRLENLVKRHFEIDSIGVTSHSPLRREEQRAVDLFNETVKRRADGHFEVGLPWRNDHRELPPSRAMAEKRFRALERKLSKQPEARSAYKNQMENLIRSQYAVKCDEQDERDSNTWYLPHFAVTNKPGKVRLVFDAAARVRGQCLNDFLLDGPDLLKSLVAILYRFREEKVAVTADIKEMFLRIKIREQDQPAQLFMWRDEPSQDITVYKMASMIFGARSSPFLAHSVRNKNAGDFATTHPRALTAITEAHYMDDYVDSYASEAEAYETIREVDYVHQQAQFHLRGWNSSETNVLRGIPIEHRAKGSLQPLTKDDLYEKTLGLLWDSSGDTLQFNTTMKKLNNEVRQMTRPPTKREALSAVMSLYDPLGLLSCYTITAKILLQSLWGLSVGWDEQVPFQVAVPFEQWLRDLEHINRLKIPRRYHGGRRISSKELHIFCDASEQAYAAAAYWRFEYEDGKVSAILVAAKAKVAPVKALTIPRLELQAALIGTRLGDHIRKEHRYDIDKTYYWTDSQVVLHWVQNGSKRYTPYVANRLGEIAELSSVDEWRWLPTHQNVADLATRPGYVPKTHEETWFAGPDFLTEPKSGWPAGTIQTNEQSTDLEAVAHIQEATDAGLPDITRFSRYEKLIRTTALLFLFRDKCRDRKCRLDVAHLQRAERAWWYKVQADRFASELGELKKGNKIHGSSPLYRLDPVENEGLLSLRGRINAARVSSGVKTPIILDGRHPFVRLLIDRDHRRAGHTGRERVVNDLRQQFWILRLRPAVREVINKCSLCRLRRARPRTPPTGDLPEERLGAFQRPFTNCGLDYFGPITVTIGRRHEKRWCALFTCLTTRAIHLELVASLSTDSAIMAMRRMAARRGWPSVMFTDNGTNFRGADVELRRAYEEWEPALRDLGLQHRMNWKFIPPGAPSQGGAWERLVRSVKNALVATLNQKHPREEVLMTLLTEAEHTLNARPLTYVSVHHEDEEALTPNHFLLGSSTGLPHVGPCEPADRRTWRAAQGLADEFWRRWVREYLPTLVPRRDAPKSEVKISIGDLVIVVDPDMPRNTWPRGIITKVHPGPDGHVRSAEVQTSNGVFRRPTSKLAVLSTSTTTPATAVIKEGCGHRQEAGDLRRGEC